MQISFGQAFELLFEIKKFDAKRKQGNKAILFETKQTKTRKERKKIAYFTSKTNSNNNKTLTKFTLIQSQKIVFHFFMHVEETLQTNFYPIQFVRKSQSHYYFNNAYSSLNEQRESYPRHSKEVLPTKKTSKDPAKSQMITSEKKIELRFSQLRSTLQKFVTGVDIIENSEGFK
ncbi:hypothetical protein RFI_37057 [Reticulomyxa filosa]|nr:hypothetical protein RFI_37057 [Reticulomyxa filosa]|eukprot:ETO00391.1 hypothetical protein RFI_37057 [Reticulomyxa filosa]